MRINSNTDPRYVWNTLRILKNKWVKINSSHVTENLQTENQLVALNKICPPWVPTNPEWIPECKDEVFLQSEFNFMEFNVTLETRKCNSSPGLDGINYDIIKKLPLKFKLLVLDIYNEIYRTGNYPTSWKRTFIHFVPKQDGKNFRPIALTSTFCKLFETILKNKFEFSIEKNNLVPNTQSGFRRGPSCADNSINLTVTILHAFKEQKEMYAVFLDISAAFDNVQSDILIQKLADIGCPSRLVSFVKFLTYERFIYTGLEDNCTYAYKGVPQGGVLSPLLYLLYVSNITDAISSRVTVSQFADDTALYSTNKNSLQIAINKMENNLFNLGLEIAPTKTVLIHFNNKGIPPGQTKIRVSNHDIKSNEYTRFLGILFDYKLSFNIHINQLLTRAYKSLNIVKFLQGIWWGSDPTCLLTVYKSLIRSAVDYASFIFFPTRKDQIKKIEQIQYNAIRMCLGYRRTTPIRILLAESKLPLIKERSKFLCCTYFTKILSNESLPVRKTILNYSKILKYKKYKRKRILENCIESMLNLIPQLITTKKYNIFLYDYKITTTAIPFDKTLGKAIQKSADPKSVFNQFLEQTNSLNIFTDGSKSTKSPAVGASSICPKLCLSTMQTLNKNSSIFTAEGAALNNALDIALKNKNSKIQIFTDSLSMLQSLQNSNLNISSNPYIFEIKKKFNQFENEKSEAGSLKFFWIPSHVGIQGNDDADSLAKDASYNNLSIKATAPFTDFREVFKKKMFTETKKFYIETSSTGHEYFTNYFSDTRKPWFHNKNIPRELIVFINRSRSNHYNLAASLARVNIVQNSKCQCGIEDQTLDHILWKCTLFITQRKELYTDLHKLKILLPINVAVLLAKPHIPACNTIICFLKRCELTV